MPTRRPWRTDREPAGAGARERRSQGPASSRPPGGGGRAARGCRRRAGRGAARRDPAAAAGPAAGPAAAGEVVPFAGARLGGASARATAAAPERRHGVEPRLEPGAAVDVGRRQLRGQGDAAGGCRRRMPPADAAGIARDVPLGARLAPVRRARAGAFAPLPAGTGAPPSSAPRPRAIASAAPPDRASGTRGGSTPTPAGILPAGRASAASRSCHRRGRGRGPSPGAAAPGGCRTSGRGGGRSAPPPGPGSAAGRPAGRPSGAAGQAAARARPRPTAHRARGARPGPATHANRPGSGSVRRS